MAISKNAVAGGITALGGTGAVAGVVIANQNKEVIGDKLKNDLLPTTTGFENEWQKLATKLKDDSESEEALKEIKTSEGETPTGTHLKGWCEKQKKESVTETLEVLVKKWCVFTIKEKLDSKVLKTETTEDTTDKRAWNHKLQTLKDFDKESGIEIENDLKTIKEEKTTSGDHWKQLTNWCKSTYEKSFQGEDKNIYKLANKFCTKPTIQEVLRGDELSQTGFDNEWTKKANKEKSSEKEEELKKIPNTNGKDQLKTWCQKQYSKDFDSKSKEGETELLLTAVKKWCVYTIKDKISEESSKVLTTTGTGNENDFKNLVKTLNKYTGTTPKLTSNLEGIKTGKTNDDDDTKWDKLRDWCNETYNKSYKGEENNLWKLAEKFCKKA